MVVSPQSPEIGFNIMKPILAKNACGFSEFVWKFPSLAQKKPVELSGVEPLAFSLRISQ